MKYTGEIILGVLFLYVIALGVVTYDEVFNEPPKLFPPPLEAEVLSHVRKLTSQSAAERDEAQAKVLDIEDFVTVPVLIHYLTDKNVVMRRMALDTLERIGQRLQGATPLPPPVPDPDNAPLDQWRRSQREWRRWMKENEQRL